MELLHKIGDTESLARLSYMASRSADRKNIAWTDSLAAAIREPGRGRTREKHMQAALPRKRVSAQPYENHDCGSERW